jgi:hypothetical protein
MKNFVKLCNSELRSWNGFTLPETELAEILNDPSNGLQATLESWNYSEDGNGLDTGERDVLHDAIAKKLGFSHWPLNMDSGKPWVTDFENALQEKFESGAWKLEN